MVWPSEPFSPNILRTFSPLFPGSQQNRSAICSCVHNFFFFSCLKAFRVFSVQVIFISQCCACFKPFLVYCAAHLVISFNVVTVPVTCGKILNYFFNHLLPSVLCFWNASCLDVGLPAFILFSLQSLISIPFPFVLLWKILSRNQRNLKYGWVFWFRFLLDCFLSRRHVGANAKTLFAVYLRIL